MRIMHQDVKARNLMCIQRTPTTENVTITYAFSHLRSYSVVDPNIVDTFNGEVHSFTAHLLLGVVVVCLLLGLLKDEMRLDILVSYLVKLVFFFFFFFE
ncbi:hypothetical protein Sjap_013925 [Stephania japonica]|uniref:Protein kinase domain-containing protein n=1 Tax=Stephania japonica TaxID=461633 RepID=A0AAP0J0M9_9MAGN